MTINQRIQKYAVDYVNCENEIESNQLLGKLYDVTSPILRRFMLKWVSIQYSNIQTNDVNDFIDDSIASSFGVIINDKKKFNPTIGIFKTWFFKVTINNFRMLLRQYDQFSHTHVSINPTDFFQEEEHGNTISTNDEFLIEFEDEYQKRNLVKTIMKYINDNYSEKQVKIFKLRFEEELKLDDIAEITNLTTPAVFYILKKINKQLSEVFYDDINELKIL